MNARVSIDSDGKLDDFYAENATIHFEAMDHNQWWIGVTLPDGSRWSIDCGAVNPRAKGYASAYQDVTS